MLATDFIERVRERTPELVVFSVVRNEKLCIRAWLQHYRFAGVTTFAIIDNGSDDGTYEFLADQPDVILTRVTDSFNASNFGINWLNEFSERIRQGTWILFADADELIIYRGWPERALLDLASQAAGDQCNAIFGFMLDMYPDGAVEEAVVSDELDLFQVAPCFDRDYQMRLSPVKPWEPNHRSIEVIGGPRVRLLSSLKRELASGWFTYFIRGQIDRFLPLAPAKMVPALVRLMPKQMPALTKIPLVLSGSGFHYFNAHGGQGAHLFRENVVFGHFKFLPDFDARVRREASRGEHYRRGAEYIMYADAMSRHDKLDLRYPGSCRFTGADQLLELGLIRDIRGFIAPEQSRAELNSGDRQNADRSKTPGH